ncbi:hypothetical protein AX15_007399 [Amanita polypyramis BW_CC]|nr:hypothetical protein AX15_007399 [Amanita polypyramis BW_CC]
MGDHVPGDSSRTSSTPDKWGRVESNGWSAETIPPSMTVGNSISGNRRARTRGKAKQKMTDAGTKSGTETKQGVYIRERMEEREFTNLLNQLKAEVKAREGERRIEAEFRALLSQLKAETKAKEEQIKEETNVKQAHHKAGRQARKARLEEENQARKAQMEAELKAKRAEVAAYEAGVTTKHIVLARSAVITCGTGLDIRHILCASDCCYLTIKNLPKNVKDSEVDELFIQQGVNRAAFYLLNLRHVDGKVEAKIMIEAEIGAVLTAGLDGSELGGETLSLTIDQNSGPNKMGASSGKNANVLTISWNLPSLSMIASYATPSDAQQAVKSMEKAVFSGRRIKAELDQGRTKSISLESTTSVKISGLAPEVEPTEVRAFANASEIRAIKSPIYNLGQLHETLKCHMEQMGGMEAYDIVPGEQNKNAMQVHVRFGTWEQAKQVYETLEGKRIRSEFPTLRAWLPQPHQYTITIPLRQYRAQKSRWDSIVEKEKDKAAFVRITENNAERAIIRVSGEDRKAVGALKVRIENLTSGEKVDGALWHQSFASTAGREFLDSVYSRTTAFVWPDRKTQTLKIFADVGAHEDALKLVKAEIEHLQSLEWSIYINRRSAGFFMRKGLPVLKEMFGDDTVTLELKSACKLVIRGGGEKARHIVNGLIEESKNDFRSIVNNRDQKLCPICQDEVSAPVLLGCGHLYCDACIRHYLTSAIGRKQFPLVCVDDDDRCKTPIAIPVIRRFLSPQQFDQLVEVAGTTYIERQPNKFKYCATPDCSQVYRCDGDRKCFTCPSCFTSVCIACKNVSHEGMTCEEWNLLNDVAEQERRNQEWASASGAKRCSRCDVLIQKIEGCNRVQCLCGAHICWVCLAAFNDSSTAYSHLNSTHGGVFDYEIN